MAAKRMSRVQQPSETADETPAKGIAAHVVGAHTTLNRDARTDARQRPTSLDVAWIRATLALSREHMARVLAVSAKTIQRWEAQGALPADPRQRALLAQVQEITDLGTTVYTPKGLRLFLETPLPTFSNRSALQMLEQGYADQVRSALISDLEGAGY